ncbi:MAG: glycosyltransferase [Candidatus Binataceae bacterium]
MTPVVSVIIPVRDGERTLARAINSALAQTYAASFEIVVVNDGSADGTAKILESFGDRIRIVNHASPSGVSNATNAGVKASRGRYLAFLHADDEWMPEKLAHVISRIETEPQTVLIYHDAELVDLQGRVKLASCHPHDHKPPTLEDILERGWPNGPMLVSAVVMRRETFDAVGGFDPALPSHEDLWMWLLALEHGRCDFVPEVLARREFELDARRAQWYLAGGRVFRSVVLKRYGRAVHVDFLGSLLVSVGLVAMARGDRKTARACYLEALRSAPGALMNYVRLIWTFVPPRLARPISRLVSANSARALTGPPRSGPFSAEIPETIQ